MKKDSRKSPHRRPRPETKPQDGIIAATWTPQPCGLSRDELRRLVAEILG